MPTTYKVTVLRGNIITLIQSGDGNRWTHDTAKKIERLARSTAPFRTGRLSRSHVTLPTTGTNSYVKVYRVSALAPYGVYVHQGTGIHPPGGRGMIIAPRGMKLPGPNPNVRRSGERSTVIYRSKGQRSKPWLANAAEAVARVI